MDPGLPCALGTALAYGLGSVLQASAVVDAAPVGGLDPRLLVTLSRTWRYPAGLGLDAVGFVLSLVALRTLPLYVVQAVTASFLAVTAVLAVPLLGLRLRRRDGVAVAVVVLGLALVGLSAAPERARPPAGVVPWLVLGMAVLLVSGTVPLARRRGGASALGAAAGLGFGVVALAARTASASLPAHPAGRLATDLRVLAGTPATWALLVAAPLALTAYAVALQRGSVVRATAPLVLGETFLPAVAGLALLGDRPRPGWAVAAVAGFVLAVGAALALARFGEVEQETATDVGGD